MEGQIRNSSISEYGPHVLTGLRMHNKRKQIFILLMSFFWTSHSYSLIILWCPRKKIYKYKNHILPNDEPLLGRRPWKVFFQDWVGSYCCIMLSNDVLMANESEFYSWNVNWLVGKVAFGPIVLRLKWKVSDPCGVFTSLAWSFHWFLLILFSNRW